MQMINSKPRNFAVVCIGIEKIIIALPDFYIVRNMPVR